MTIVTPGYGPGVQGSDPHANDGFDASHTSYRVGNMVLHAATPEELDSILNELSVKLNKPVDQIRMSDITLNFSYKNYSFSTPDANGVTTLTLAPKALADVQAFNDKEFFGGQIPFFPKGSDAYLKFKFDSSLTGEALSAALGGLAGSAQFIYNQNYPTTASTLPTISNADLDPKTLALLQKMFGPNTQFNQGHLNVLKMMGLVSGDATGPASSWMLSDKGTTVLTSFNSAPQPAFVPSMGLFGLNQTAVTKAHGVNAYFSGNGYAMDNGNPPKPKFGAADVEKIAKEILNGLPEIKNEKLPDGLTINADSTELLNDLFGLPAGNTTFTANQINTAVSMGLIKFDPNTNTVTVTTNGGIYLADKRANPGGKPTEAPAPTNKQKRDAFFREMVTLSMDDTVSVMDWLEWKADPSVSPDNGRTGTAGLHLLANLVPGSDDWNAVKAEFGIDDKRLGDMVNAAKQALNPAYSAYITEVYGPDGVAEKGDLANWVKNYGPVG